MKIFKKILSVLFLLFATLFINKTFAAIDTFSIEVNDTINAGESVDFTISAIKDGDILKEYVGYVRFILKDSNGNILDKDLYKLPSDELYDFKETDQGTKTFSKGLEIKKPGTYTLRVEELLGDEIFGSTSITVLGESGTENLEMINIEYPTNGSVETKSYFTIIGGCEKLKNSPVVIYLNDKIAGSGNTDSNGKFSILVPDLLSGNNEIQAKIVDINNLVLGESPVISVKYQKPEDGIYKSIEILPSREIKQGDKIVLNVNTDDSVSSAQLILSNGLRYSMDRIGQGIFSKEIEQVSFTGLVDVSLSLISNSNEKIYENIETISVKEYIGVSNIKFTNTGVDGSQVIISRESIGNIPRYQIRYGTGKESLDKFVNVTSSSVLIENLDKDTSYFFQIIPQDNESHDSGEPSEIVEYRSSALSCVVKGIKVTTEKIGDNYYLVRDQVENAISYEVYRSDRVDMTDARLVGNLTGTRFQYLYNPDSEKDEYAFYQVQAICPDGNNVVVDKAQKVKVGPVENILLIIIISIFVYAIYKLNRLSDKEL